MTTIAFTEFRRHASDLLTRAEKGEKLVVMRHGRAIVEIGPVAESGGGVPSWKRPGIRLTVKGAGLSSAILKDRTREDVL